MQTETDRSPSQTVAESGSTPSVSSQILDNFKASKEYRHAFVEEKVRTGIAAQIKAIREQRQKSRPAFATMMNKAPSWVFRLEDPNQSPPTISTLLQVAEAFDVDLSIHFESFTELLHRLDRMTPESFEVPSFEEELKDDNFDQKPLAASQAPVAGILNAGSSQDPGTASGTTQYLRTTPRKGPTVEVNAATGRTTIPPSGIQQDLSAVL